MNVSLSIAALALTTAAVLVPSTAAASQPIHLTNTEQGYVFHPEHAGAAPRVSAAGPRVGEATADGFRYVGGDQAWQVEPHRLVQRNNRWVHADALTHNAPRPTLSLTEQERRMLNALYTNG